MQATLTDANVLYPSLLRNLLMHLAVVGACELRWTDQIHEEWLRNLVGKSAQDSTKLERTRRLMEEALPGARVSGYEALISGLSLPDPDDRHVLAAAIRAGASEILTYNLRDFPPAATEPHGVKAIHPDMWLCSLLERQPEIMLLTVKRMLSGLKNPPLSADGLCSALDRLGLPQASERLTPLLSAEDNA